MNLFQMTIQNLCRTWFEYFLSGQSYNTFTISKVLTLCMYIQIVLYILQISLDAIDFPKVSI